MVSYSFNAKPIQGNLYYRVWNEIQKNKGYFYTCNKNNAEEAMSRTLMHCLEHYNEEKGELRYYILALAATIMRGDHEKELYLEYLEDVVTSDGSIVVKDKNAEDNKSTKAYKNHTDDFSEDIITQVYVEETMEDQVTKLALSYPELFLKLSEAIIKQDMSKMKFPTEFKKQCLALAEESPMFNEVCVALYHEYEQALRVFVDMANFTRLEWDEADYDFLKRRQTKKPYIFDEYGLPVVDADTQAHRIHGKMAGKIVLRIEYLPILDAICEKATEPVSELSLTINGLTVYRTPAGSVGVLGTTYDGYRELVKNEIVTNIVRDINGRILNIGSEAVYMICDETNSRTIPKRTILGGVETDFLIETVMESWFK